tara:strand:+ start:1346 stop:1636 length:291 start_codon:yes stop_codon:yes gene_type:complete
MSKSIVIKKSTKPDKKLMAVFDIDGKKRITHFGATGYKDYTSGATEEQRKAYRSRHAKDLDTNDPTRAGYLSYYILWSEKSLKDAISKYKKRFGFS